MAQLQRAKGTRDFNPAEKILRNEIVDILKKNFELSGFSPIETPIIERFDVLSSKYAGGSEILKETFKFKDQGKRELALRYDLTVPLCRFVGMNPDMKLPFKRYQIERVFRDGPIKLGRYREFYQCDIDIVGSNSMLAEMQLIEIANKIFNELNLDVEIKINNRKLMNGLMTDLEIKEKEKVILIIDKLNKISLDEIKKEILNLDIDEEKIDKLFSTFNTNNLDEINVNNEEGINGLNELKELFNYLKKLNINAKFDITLARGLSYYTGTVFEVFLKNNEIKSACAGGGRYDNMISNFLQSKQKYPAVGISFGLEVLSDALKNKIDKKNITELFIIPINTINECIKIASKLREKNIKVDFDLMNRGISKNLQYANSLGIKYVAIIGEDEIKQNKIKIKNMISGEEKLYSIDEIKLD
jgi:histidyl-tRNA synthetase